MATSCVLVALVLGCAASPEAPLATTPPEAAVAELVERGDKARSRGDWDAAVASYRSALERTPWNERLRGHLATALNKRAEKSRSSGKYAGVTAAESDLRQALEVLPGDPVLQRNLGVVLLDLATRSVDRERAAALVAEAIALDPALAADVADIDPVRERRLDLAMELIERGQLEAGIDRLDALHQERPADVEVGVLLAQGHSLQGQQLVERGNLAGAAEAYDAAAHALEAYAPAALPQGELERIQRNRITAWLNAGRPERARAALAEAESAGIDLPLLRRSLGPP